MGGGKQPSSTTTTTNPWVGQQKYLTRGFEEAQRLYDMGGPAYYPGSTLAPTDWATNMALNMTQDRALRGSPLGRQAQDTIMATARGDFLGGNPYLDTVIGNTANDIGKYYRENVVPGIDSEASMLGRYASDNFAKIRTDADTNLGKTIADTSSNMRMQNYQTERQNQLMASQLAPSLIGMDYNDMAKLAAVGSAREGIGQDTINSNIDRYNYEQQLPYNNLLNYLSMIQGQYGGSATTTGAGSRGSNPLLGALGGAGTAAGLASSFGMFGAPAVGATAATAASPFLWPLIIGGGIMGAFG